MIYYDVSEGRANTRLSEKILDLGQPVVGLESATGADLLISPKEGLGGNVNNLPDSALLPLYIQSGFLVQRKSGNDFLNSIQKLGNILWRMRVVGDKAGARCWLLVCADIRMSSDGKTILDNQDTGWNFLSVQGALYNWSILGGHYSVVNNDVECTRILRYWDDLVPKFAEFDKKGFELKPNIPEVDYGQYPWRDTLMTFPGIGDVMADKIAEHNQRLCDSLVWLSQEDSYGVPGVGAKTLANARRKLGLEDGEGLAVLRDKPTIHE